MDRTSVEVLEKVKHLEKAIQVAENYVDATAVTHKQAKADMAEAISALRLFIREVETGQGSLSFTAASDN